MNPPLFRSSFEIHKKELSSDLNGLEVKERLTKIYPIPSNTGNLPWERIRIGWLAAGGIRATISVYLLQFPEAHHRYNKNAFRELEIDGLIN